MPFQLPDGFTNLGSAFEAQQQQAGLAGLLSDEQFKQIQALNDPSTNLALAKQTADARAAYPTLKTDVNATGMGEGIMKGLSNAFSNGQQIRSHNQQVGAYQDIEKNYQQSQAQQRELVMGQVQAAQQRDVAAQQHLQGSNPAAAGLYPYLDPAGRQSMLSGIGTQELGLQYDPLKHAATKEIDLQYKPREGTADGQAQVNKGQAINTAIGQMPPVEVGGIPQAGRMNAVRNIQGSAPITTLDTNKQYMENQAAANNLKYQPGKLKSEQTQRDYDTHIKQVESEFKRQETILGLKRDQLANQKNTVDYNKALKEYSNFETGRNLFHALKESGALNSSDPNKQSQIQAELGSYGVKYDPPNTPYTTIKDKTGAIWQVDKGTGLVRPLINKGGKAVTGEWHQKT